MSGLSDAQRERAYRGGRLAARAGRGLGGACPYDANGTPVQRLSAVWFVRGYLSAGGTVDGVDLGDLEGDVVESSRRSRRVGGGGSGPGSRAYGHLGYPS